MRARRRAKRQRQVTIAAPAQHARCYRGEPTLGPRGIGRVWQRCPEAFYGSGMPTTPEPPLHSSPPHSSPQHSSPQQLTRIDRPATRKGPAATFTGDVYIDALTPGDAASQPFSALVRFAPGARTHWHSHPQGQVLHCTDGVGFVGSRDGQVVVLHAGETVWTPPGLEHWHGGTRDRLMCHLAMVEVPADGVSTTWLEPVSDDQYTAAHAAL